MIRSMVFLFSSVITGGIIAIPLAFPVIFTGIRIAFIQTIGGAILAGLVGGGGMESFLFLGLRELVGK